MFSPRIRKDQAAPSATFTDKPERRSSIRTAQKDTDDVFHDALDNPESTALFSWDFGQVAVFRSDRTASSVAGDGNLVRQQSAAGNHAKTKSEVKRHRYTFSAVVPRALPVYNDAARPDEPKPATASAAQSIAAAVPVRSDGIPEPRPGEAVHFPGVLRPSTPVSSQSDMGISSTFKYTSAITQTNDAPDPGVFGSTRPTYSLTHVAAMPRAQYFAVIGDINDDVRFSVTSQGRTNIASDSDPNITQSNYPDVAKDLTPLRATVTRSGRTIFKNEPPRDLFWAEDLTIKHESFHADEDVRFGQEGVTAAQDWLNTQRISKVHDIEGLLQPIIDKVRDTVEAAMAFPGREERAYADGASAYRDRAQAIKRKGDAKGYVLQSPAPQPPTPQPPVPKAPAAQAPAPSPTPPRRPEK
jgi:hypothetical protein